MSESFESRLRRLPARRAPAALSARVLAAASLYAQPWHRRPFWTWSAPAQAGFSLAMAVAAALLFWQGAELAGRLSWLGALSQAAARLLWSARLPIVLLAALAAAPAAALTGLVAVAARRR